jgi:hypothetical protein
MTIEAIVAQLAAEAETAQGRARRNMRADAVMVMLRNAFPEMTLGEAVVTLADVVGEMIRISEYDPQKGADAIALIVRMGALGLARG